jgi:hypothetical protein
MAREPAPLAYLFPQRPGLHPEVRPLGLCKGAHGGVGRLRLEVDVVTIDPPDVLPARHPGRLLADLLPAPAPAVGVWRLTPLVAYAQPRRRLHEVCL